MRIARPAISLAALLLGTATPCFAQTKFVEFDHLSGEDAAVELQLADRERFEVRITNTCEPAFSYEVRGILRAAPAPERATVSATVPLTTKRLQLVHDARYGGYIVSISRTVPTDPCGMGDKLQPRTILISTPELNWDLAFSGGFTVTNLTHPAFHLRPHPSDATKKQVQRDEDAEDDVALGIATFVHLYHRRTPWLGGVFGLGIREGNKTEYFLGAGVRFSDKATLNTGLVLGPVNRLPAGVNTTDPVSDDNVLNNLPTRVDRGFFVGISYSFINVRDKLQAPFAGAGTGGGSTGTAPGGGATGSTGRGAAQPAGACATLTFDRTSLSFPVGGGSEMVKLTVPAATPTCTWKVEPLDGGITITPSEGKGNATITVKLAENTGTARKTTVMINKSKLEIQQPAKP